MANGDLVRFRQGSRADVVSTAKQAGQLLFATYEDEVMTTQGAESFVQGDIYFDLSDGPSGIRVNLANDVDKARTLFAGQTSTSDTAGQWTATIDGITKLYDGLTIVLRLSTSYNSTFNSLNVNGLGAKLVWYRKNSRLTSHVPNGAEILLVYRTAAGSYTIPSSSTRGDITANTTCTDGWILATSYADGNTVPSAYCSTAAATTAKTASCTGYAATANHYIHIVFSNTNTANVPTLNINSTGAKPIYLNGQPVSASNHNIVKGSYIAYYDGTAYYLRNDGILPGQIEKATSADVASTLANGANIVAGSIDSNDHLPNATNTYNLGSSSKIWKQLYVNDIIAGNEITTPTLAVATNATIGGNLTVSGTINATINGNATSATGFANAKTIALTGDVTGSGSGGNGNNGWSIATTIGTGKVTNDMLAGNITNAKLVNAEIGIAGNQVALGSGIAASTLLSSLGLSSAMHFIGKATVDITDGGTQNPTISGYDFTNNKKAGDVIIDKNDNYEYVWTAAGKWERLGPDSSYKVVQTAYDSSSITTSDANSSLMVSDVSQNAQGVITVTKKNVITPQSFIIKANGSSAENAGYWSFDGSTVRTINFVPGTGISITGSNGQITIANTVENTHYTANMLLSASANSTTELGASATQANPYLSLIENNTVRKSIQFNSAGNTTISGNSSSITISSTDEKVKQSVTTTDQWRKVLLHYTTNSAGGDVPAATINQVYAAKGVEIQPSTGTLRVNTLKAVTGFDYSGITASSVPSGSTEAARHIWFSDYTNKGTPVYDDNFKYNPTTNVLTVGSITGSAASATTATTANKVANTMVISGNGGTTENSGKWTFDGSNNKTINIKAGTGISITNGTNEITIANTVTDTDTHHTATMYLASSAAAKSNITAATQNPYLNLVENDTVRKSIRFEGGGYTDVKGSADASKIIITSTDQRVQQTNNTSTNGALRLLLSSAANDTEVFDKVYKNANLTYNPSTKELSTYDLKTTHIFTYSGIETGTSAGDRPVWYSYLGVNGRPVINADQFKYNPGTNTLTVGTVNGNLSGNATTATTATKVSNSLVLKIPKPSGDTDWTEGTNKWTFDGETNKSITISAGSGIALTGDANSGFTIASTGIGTDDKVKQTNTTSNSNYRVLLSYGANDNEETNQAYKSAQLLFNPYTKTVTAENFAGTATTALSAGAFSSNATVTLTGDTTGTSAGSTKSWSVPTVTKYISGLGRRTSAAAIALNPSVDTGFKMTWHISDSTSRTNDATNSPSFDAAIINLPWDWGGYNGQIALQNTVAGNTRMQIRSATSVDNGSSANPRYTPNYGAWREVVTATKATQIGSSTTPIYISNTGQATACGDSLDVSITGNAATATTVLWSGINNKPETATRWPKWNEITQQGANSIDEGTSDFTDNTEIFSSYASNNGFADSNAVGKVYRRDAIKMYNYIKTKAGTSGSGFNIAGSSASCTGNAASASKVNSSLVIKVSDGGTEAEGTNKWTFDGSTTKSITIAAGTGISLTGNANTGFTITSTAIGTDDKVKQTNTTTNANYRVLLSHSANDTEETDQSYKSSGLIFNPSTNTLTATNFAGTATKVSNSLAIRIPKASGASDWTEDSTKWTFDGSGPKVIDIAAGSGISITSSTNGFTITNTARDSHYTTAMYLGASNSATTNNANNTTSPYLMVLDNSTVRNRVQFTGSGATTVTGTASSNNPTGTITIASTDENVQQLIDNSGNVNYRLLLTKEANTQNTVGATHFSTNLMFNPSTGLMSGQSLSLTGTLTVAQNATFSNLVSANGGLTASELSVTGDAAFSVTPTAPTAAAGTNDTTLATTAFVNAALQSGVMGNGSPLKVARYDGTGGVIEAAVQHTVNNYVYQINDATDGGQGPAFKLVGKNHALSLLIGTGNDNRGIYSHDAAWTDWLLYWDSDRYALLNSGKFGINGKNNSYNFYVNGSSFFNGNILNTGNTTHNGIVYFANGTTYYINNSAQGYLANLSVGTGTNTSYKLYVAGESYFNGNVNIKNIYHWNANAVQDGSWVTGTTGTASAVGTNILTLGNATASGTINNSKGYLRLYGASTGYGQLTYNDSMFESNKSIYLSNTADSGISNQVRGIMAGTDYWRIAGGATAADSGYLEIATTGDSNEPIYVRQYGGTFGTVGRTLTLLDAEGNTTVPGYIYRTYSASNQTPMLWMNGMDYDNYLFQISSGSGSGKQYYGYGLKYIGSGSGAANYLQLLADNQNGTDVIAIGVDQSGRVGIGDNASTDYRLYVNGDSQFKGSLLPQATDTYDLGSAALRWKTMYVSQFNPDYTYKNSSTVTVKASEWTNIIAGNTTGLDDGTYIIQLKITSTSNTAYYSGICSWIKATSSAVNTYSEIPLHAVQKGLANQFYLRTAIDGSGIYLQISQTASANTSLAANAMTISFKKIM